MYTTTKQKSRTTLLLASSIVKPAKLVLCLKMYTKVSCNNLSPLRLFRYLCPLQDDGPNVVASHFVVLRMTSITQWKLQKKTKNIRDIKHTKSLMNVVRV